MRFFRILPVILFPCLLLGESPILPNPRLTPGDVLPVTKEDICVPGYSQKVRDVPEKLKEEVYKLYGIRSHKPREYEVDHLISLELGGSNSIKNLWPESYETEPWNAKVKDVLENRLHKLVCEGRLALKTAQREEATDWIGAYKKYVGGPLASAPYPKPAAVATPQTSPWPFKSAVTSAPSPAVAVTNSPAPSASASSSEAKVWVNTKSDVYFQPGTRYYGTTKEGEYMTEADALKAGFHASKE
jgi:hypothetical protein